MRAAASVGLRVGAVIQARMGSSRLPGKVLATLHDRPVLQFLLERAARCDGLETVIVATSTEPADDPVAAFCAGRAEVHRGPLDDVARRMAAAAAAQRLDALVRLCADSPLIDPALIDRAVGEFRRREPDIVTNVHPVRSFPPGQSVEVVRTAALLDALDRMAGPADREHVTPYFYRNPGRYRIHTITAGRDYGDLRLAVDTPEDLDRLAALVASLSRPEDCGLDGLADAAARLPAYGARDQRMAPRTSVWRG